MWLPNLNSIPYSFLLTSQPLSGRTFIHFLLFFMVRSGRIWTIQIATHMSGDNSIMDYWNCILGNIGLHISFIRNEKHYIFSDELGDNYSFLYAVFRVGMVSVHFGTPSRKWFWELDMEVHTYNLSSWEGRGRKVTNYRSAQVKS
jgi:hypothetical protein